MYKLFIADDEKEIREGLKCILDWQALGFDICGEAGSGEETLRAVLELEPDLVLLDIRMPKMLGTDIAREARSLGFTGHFIIISGYSDFSYAQRLISCNVDSYLTKPIDEDELAETIALVKRRLEKEQLKSNSMESFRKAAKNVLLRDLIKGTGNFHEIDCRELSLDASCYQVVLYENFNKDMAENAYSFAELLKVTNRDNQTFEYLHDDNEEIILLKGEYAMERFQRFLLHYEQTPQKGSPLDSLFLAYGQKVENYLDVHHSYNQASRLLSRRFFCVQGQHTLGWDELPEVENKSMVLTDSMPGSYSDDITNLIQSCNRKKLAEKLFSLEQILYNVRNDIEEVKLFLTDLFLRIKEKINHLYSTFDIPFPSNSSIIDIIQSKYYLFEIITFLSEQFEMIMNAVGNPSRSSIMDDILHYINHNFQENIKLESIAPLFGYNSAYLGKLFSKTVGESFNSYLDNKRIQRSKELLLQDNLKVYEIAGRVGYNNIDYFHKKFKKYVGLSPAEYRRIRLEGQ